MARPTKKIIQPINVSIEQMTKAIIQNGEQRSKRKNEIERQCSKEREAPQT